MPLLFLFFVCLSLCISTSVAQTQKALPAPVVWPAPRVTYDFAQRTDRYMSRTFSPRRLAWLSAEVSMNNYIFDGGKEWGRNPGNYRNSVAIAFEQRFITNTTELFVSQMLGEDNRYVVSEGKGFAGRVRHAVFGAFIARNRDGNVVPDYSHLIAVSAGVAISNQQRPFPKSGGEVGLSIGSSLADRIGDNLRREFGVDEKLKAFGHRMAHKVHR